MRRSGFAGSRRLLIVKEAIRKNSVFMRVPEIFGISVSCSISLGGGGDCFSAPGQDAVFLAFKAAGRLGEAKSMLSRTKDPFPF